ncbi:DUF2498 family protein [Photorhabdus heterorhabditis]|uniref:DUF2498 family protein n=1 Tax=Photorhabdus heterorhabditis TaxID=880156 RepID=UPI0014288E87
MNETIIVNKIFHLHYEKSTLYLIKNDAQQIIFDKDRQTQKRTTSIKRKQLLEKTNFIIRQHEDFIDGMYANSAEQKGEIFVSSGEFSLNENG